LTLPDTSRSCASEKLCIVITNNNAYKSLFNLIRYCFKKYKGKSSKKNITYKTKNLFLQVKSCFYFIKQRYIFK
jgi:hypothetical protein